MCSSTGDMPGGKIIPPLAGKRRKKPLPGQGIQVPVSDTPSGMPARRLDRPLSELLEFLRFPSQWIEQLPASGWPLTTRVTVDVATDDDDDRHHSSCDGFGCQECVCGHQSTSKCQCTIANSGYDLSICMPDWLMFWMHRPRTVMSR